MAIERRTITRYGDKGALMFSREKVGERVIVISDTDLDSFKKMIISSALLDEVSRQQLFEMQRQLNDFSARLAFVERFLTSSPCLNKKSNDNQTEPESDEQPLQRQENHSEGLSFPKE